MEIIIIWYIDDTTYDRAVSLYEQIKITLFGKDRYIESKNTKDYIYVTLGEKQMKIMLKKNTSKARGYNCTAIYIPTETNDWDNKEMANMLYAIQRKEGKVLYY